MAVKAPYAAPVWSWTGFYIGGHVGAGWGTTESTLDNIVAPGIPAVAVGLPIAQNSRSGFLGGGQVGYNFQSGWAVFGVQGDIAGMDVKGTTPCIVVLSCSAKSDWLATVSGRFGGVVADKTLVYVKGGAAWLHTTHSLNIPALGGVGGLGFTGLSADSTALGWLLGFGAEYAFTPNWSAFIEYDYMDFEKKNVAFNLAIPGGPTATANANIQNKLSIAKVGVNYKF
jgi:outer membrane immunogenic protein